jgi:hypothetical protein
VPCLPLGERTQLRLEFLFVPSDGRPVTLMAASDPEAARAERLRRCISHMRPKQTPDYPVFDVRREHQGTAVVRMEFSDRESPPRVSVLDEGGSASFGTTAAEHATGFRLPCHDGAGPVPVLTLYVFKLAGAIRVVLRDLPLLTLVRSFRGVRQANVYFDFNAMGCPFDVHFSPMQPHAPNWVGEVGNPHPERRFFLDWLSRQEFDLDPVQVNQVLGQQAVVSVPCTVLNLGSRTGGGASQ